MPRVSAFLFMKNRTYVCIYINIYIFFFFWHETQTHRLAQGKRKIGDNGPSRDTYYQGIISRKKGRPCHLRGSRRLQHSSGNVPCDSCAVLRWLPGLGSSPGINHTIWYRQSRSVYLAGMRPVFQWLVGALSKTCADAPVSGISH